MGVLLLTKGWWESGQILNKELMADNYNLTPLLDHLVISTDPKLIIKVSFY